MCRRARWAGRERLGHAGAGLHVDVGRESPGWSPLGSGQRARGDAVGLVAVSSASGFRATTSTTTCTNCSPEACHRTARSSLDCRARARCRGPAAAGGAGARRGGDGDRRRQRIGNRRVGQREPLGLVSVMVSVDAPPLPCTLVGEKALAAVTLAGVDTTRVACAACALVPCDEDTALAGMVLR